MKNLVLACVLLCSLVGYAQKNKVGISFSPNYAYRIYQSDNQFFRAPILNEVPKLGYSASILFERDFHKKASFFTGVSFFNNGYQTEEVDILYSDITPIPPNPALSYRIRTSLYQIGIPIGVNLFFPVKKVRFFLSAGTLVNYLAQFRETRFVFRANGEIDNSSSSISNEFYKPFSAAAFGSFGVEFNLAENYVMRIAPNIYYSFTNIMDDKVAYKVFPNSSGVSFSMYKPL